MFSYISSLFNDPLGTLAFLALALPGRLMAITVHEFAHAWMANRCGDPTARSMGRLTLNPLKHLDLVGTLMMVLVGFGWARPVPVNPRNYRSYRRDDLKVSIAGVTMNFIMFLAGALVLTGFLLTALNRLPQIAATSALSQSADSFITTIDGARYVVVNGSYSSIRDVFLGAPYTYISDFLIAPALGSVAGIIYSMFGYFVQTNIILAVFNLLPVPPLDGYHVLNDLVLKRPLFAQLSSQRMAMGILMVLMFTGVLGTGLAYVEDALIRGLGAGLYALSGLIGLV